MPPSQRKVSSPDSLEIPAPVRKTNSGAFDEEAELRVDDITISSSPVRD
jgi:hypothetical protein